MRMLAAAVTVVTLVSCASGTHGPKALAVQVFEARARLESPRPRTVEGGHAFRIRVTNQSEETVTIDSISLGSFSNEMTFHNADLIVEETLEPGQTTDIAMFVDVTLVAMSHMYAIDSVDVAITCHSSVRGNFTESGSHTVVVE